MTGGGLVNRGKLARDLTTGALIDQAAMEIECELVARILTQLFENGVDIDGQCLKIATAREPAVRTNIQIVQ